MNAAVLHGPGEFVIEDRPIPEVGPEDVLLKVRACGVCGTDAHIYHGDFRVTFPVVPGHEYSGEVVDAGQLAHLRVGDRVTVDPNIACGICPYCRRGEIQFCQNLTALGVNMDGGFEDYCLVPHKQAYKIPDSLSYEEAAFIEPLACCVHGIDRADVRAGDRVVVLGGGPIGMLLIQLAKAAGAERVIVSEPQQARRDLAIELGADLAIDPTKTSLREAVLDATGIGADVVIEAAGLVATVEQTPQLARRGGTILLFGVTETQAQAVFKPYDLFNNELTIRGSFINPFTHSRAIALLASGQVRVDKLISHRFGVAQAEEAIQASRTPGTLKVMVEPWGREGMGPEC